MIDRKGLAALGFGRESLDRMKRELPTVQFPGERKFYWRRQDVQAYIERHTQPPMRGAA